MEKIDKVYFTSGVDTNVFNNKVFGICCILQEKINELIEGYNKHSKEYTAVLDRIEDILDRLRQLGG